VGAGKRRDYLGGGGGNYCFLADKNGFTNSRFSFYNCS